MRGGGEAERRKRGKQRKDPAGEAEGVQRGSRGYPEQRQRGGKREAVGKQWGGYREEVERRRKRGRGEVWEGGLLTSRVSLPCDTAL